MSFEEELKALQSQSKIGEYFTAEDVKAVTSNPEANNLSNYFVDNAGSSNRNAKFLNRRKNVNEKNEYFFN